MLIIVKIGFKMSKLLFLFLFWICRVEFRRKMKLEDQKAKKEDENLGHAATQIEPVLVWADFGKRILSESFWFKKLESIASFRLSEQRPALNPFR